LPTLAPGLVFEIATPEGLAYFQYVSRDGDYGELIRVLPGVFRTRPEDPLSLALEEELYSVFFPVSAALRRGIVTKVGKGLIPGGKWRRRSMRRPGAREKGGRILTWVIEEEGGERVVNTLAPEQLKLPMAVIWNDTMLKERIAEGWRPEDEIEQ